MNQQTTAGRSGLSSAEVKSYRCTRCSKRHLITFVWLELDTHTGLYHTPGTLPLSGLSQGLFPFGITCASVQLAKQHSTEKTPSETDWEKAERKAKPRRVVCPRCGEEGHRIQTCPKWIKDSYSGNRT